MVDIGGKQMHPGSTEKLMAYWAEGKGAAVLKWGTPGDFDRCVLHIQKAVTDGGSAPLPDGMIKGLCSNLHRRATGGFSPGKAPGEQMPGKH